MHIFCPFRYTANNLLSYKIIVDIGTVSQNLIFVLYD